MAFRALLPIAGVMIELALNPGPARGFLWDQDLYRWNILYWGWIYYLDEQQTDRQTDRDSKTNIDSL